MHLQTAKDLRRKGRPSAAHTCTATRREEHERSLEAEMNPRVGAVYEVSKRRVPTLEQRRNGIPFVSHGEQSPRGAEVLFCVVFLARARSSWECAIRAVKPSCWHSC